jgi:hypothetical protein
VHVLARRLVGVGPIERHAVELALRALIDAAHPDVADPLTAHRRLPTQDVRLDSKTLWVMCQLMAKRASN